MCTIVILRRPDHAWPLLVAANRDEMIDRPWDPPGRHWPDRPRIVAGRDRLAGGSWLGRNDDGVIAAVTNREGSLGPAAGKRSRGELVLEALAHRSAREAARMLEATDTSEYRSFNMIIADRKDTYWIAARQGRRAAEVREVPPGLSMLTSKELNDESNPRTAFYLPKFRAAPEPQPDRGDWSAWRKLLASREFEPTAGPGGAMCIVTDTGFATVSSTLLALPRSGAGKETGVYLFAAGRPDLVPYRPVRV